eukprot:TRINITY_DN5216_c0_g1_i3.p1 TRINITY_DN5216_c0_g1~~TRINITY_DN5216_c0_g1_i3.p1  ORF type:complete len:165 (+),score=37.38 TRINITY_DN5216_c0_g1_i3:72-566(+)
MMTRSGGKPKEPLRATRHDGDRLPPVSSPGKIKTSQEPIGGAGREALRLLQAKHDQQWTEVQQHISQHSTDEWDLDELNTELSLLDQRSRNLSAYEKTFQQWQRELDTKNHEHEKTSAGEKKVQKQASDLGSSSRRKELPPVSPRKGSSFTAPPKSSYSNTKSS